MMENVNHSIKIYNNFDAQLDIKRKDIEEYRAEYDIIVFQKEKVPLHTDQPALYLEWNIPMLDIGYQWHPTCGLDRSLKADWESALCSMTSISAPVMCFYNEAGENRFTFSLSEVKKPVTIHAGVHEENAAICFKIVIPMEDCIGKENDSVQLYFSSEPVFYADVLHRVSLWWENICNLLPMQIPVIATLPMYSSWYSFHQDMDAGRIEEECKRAKELGFHSIIVDDGWQTEDNNRGYAFCGDWKCAESKFPNMKEHVAAVHRIGLHYILWFSVPFMGRYSENWDIYKDKILWYDEEREAGVLDIRYEEIRNYLLNIYVTSVKTWDIDGLKLDFIDEFYMREGVCDTYKQEMDFSCVQDALDCLMTKIMTTLKKIKPNLIIEFRQRYIGPNMRKYGNIFRVADCPGSSIRNRVGIVDLRLLSGNTAVHSDMIMWNKRESPESAALQILNAIFSTIQISVRLDELDCKQRKMLCFWISFLKEHQETLQSADIKPYEPQHLYPVIEAESREEKIIAVYSANRVIRLTEPFKNTIIINAAKEKSIVVSIQAERMVDVKSQNCLGDMITESSRNLSAGYHEYAIEPSGLLTFL